MTAYKKNELKALLFVLIVYFIAHFLIILSRGFLWDGLHVITLLNDHAYGKLWPYLGQFKPYALYGLVRVLILFGGNLTVLIKIITFFNWLAAGAALYVILRKYIRFAIKDSVFIAVCFFLFPAFPFKGELAYLHFSMANAVFFLAALVYFWAEKRSKIFRRFAGYALASVLFLLSFTTNSLLVFYGGFLLVLLARAHKNKIGPVFPWFLSWCRDNAFFIILPIAFWIFQSSLPKPQGELGVNYGDLLFFQPGFLRMTADNIWNFVAYGLFWPFVGSISILQRRIFAALFIAAFCGLIFLSRALLPNSEDTDPRDISLKPLHYFLWGIVWFVLGIFPYIAVGAYPTIYGDGFHMRYGILIPLGASLMILGAIRGLVKEKWQGTAECLLLAAFISFNIYNYFTLDMDLYRREAVVASLRDTKSREIIAASTLVFHDEYQEHKYIGRNIKTSEYTLYLHQAYFPKSYKFGFAIGDVSPDKTVEGGIMTNYYRAVKIGIWPPPDNFNPLAKIVDVSVISNADHETMTVGEWLTLKKYELFSDQSTFTQKLKDELKIEVVPIVPEKIITPAP